MESTWLLVDVKGDFNKRFEENGWDKPRYLNFSYDMDTYSIFLFNYIKAVIDSSSNITLTETVVEKAESSYSGVYCYDYITKSGIEFTLTLYGGDMLPEISSYSFTCSEFSEELIEELRIAFGEYYRTDFKFYEFTGSVLKLYESEEYKNNSKKRI